MSESDHQTTNDGAATRSSLVYVDHAATTPVRPAAAELMSRIQHDAFGNPSARHHAPGRAAATAIDCAREQVAAAVGARPDEVTFTSGATEACNIAILGAMSRLLTQRPRMVLAATEHPAVLAAADFVGRCGGEISLVPVDSNGQVDHERVAHLLNDRTGMLAVMLVNNETGVVNEVPALAALAAQAGALTMVDATQAVGRLTLDRAQLGADLLAFSGHKCGGSKGAGALVMKRGLGLDPIVHGGGQERGLRPGTENVAAIAAMGLAVQYAADEARDGLQRSITEAFEQRLTEALPDAVIHGQHSVRAPGISFVGLPPPYPLGSTTWLGATNGIAASSGSSCSSGGGKPSAVLTAMGVDSSLAKQSVRISFGHSSTIDDAIAAADALVHSAQRLHALTTE